MNIAVALPEHGPDELLSLQAWLQREEALRGRVRPVQSSPRGEQMASVADALVVAVGSGGALAVLARSLHVWLQQPRRSTVRVRITGPNGVEVHIVGEHVSDPSQLETLLRESLRGGNEPG